MSPCGTGTGRDRCIADADRFVCGIRDARMAFRFRGARSCGLILFVEHVRKLSRSATPAFRQTRTWVTRRPCRTEMVCRSSSPCSVDTGDVREQHRVDTVDAIGDQLHPELWRRIDQETCATIGLYDGSNARSTVPWIGRPAHRAVAPDHRNAKAGPRAEKRQLHGTLTRFRPSADSWCREHRTELRP